MDRFDDDVDFLADLAERLMHIPVMYGTDEGDVSRLRDIARHLPGITHYMPDQGLPYITACGIENPIHSNDTWYSDSHPITCPRCLLEKDK